MVFKDDRTKVGGGPTIDDFKTEKEQKNIKPSGKTPKIQSDSKHLDEIPEEKPTKKSKWT